MWFKAVARLVVLFTISAGVFIFNTPESKAAAFQTPLAISGVIQDMSCDDSGNTCVVSTLNPNMLYVFTNGSMTWSTQVSGVRSVSCNFSNQVCALFGSINAFIPESAAYLFDLNQHTVSLTSIGGGGGPATGSCAWKVNGCIEETVGDTFVSYDGGRSYSLLSTDSDTANPVHCNSFECYLVLNALQVKTFDFNSRYGHVLSVLPQTRTVSIDDYDCAVSICYAEVTYKNGSSQILSGLPNSDITKPVTGTVSPEFTGLKCYSDACFAFGTRTDNRPILYKLTGTTARPYVQSGYGYVVALSAQYLAVVYQSGTHSSIITPLFNLPGTSSAALPVNYATLPWTPLPTDATVPMIGDSIALVLAITGNSADPYAYYSGLQIIGCSIECIDNSIPNTSDSIVSTTVGRGTFDLTTIRSHFVNPKYQYVFEPGFWDLSQFSDGIWQNHVSVFQAYVDAVNKYVYLSRPNVWVLSVFDYLGDIHSEVLAINAGLRSYVVPTLQASGMNAKYCDLNSILYPNGYTALVNGVIINGDGIHPSYLGSLVILKLLHQYCLEQNTDAYQSTPNSDINARLLSDPLLIIARATFALPDLLNHNPNGRS
jgi:hypothetical protein